MTVEQKLMALATKTKSDYKRTRKDQTVVYDVKNETTRLIVTIFLSGEATIHLLTSDGKIDASIARHDAMVKAMLNEISSSL